MTGLTNAKSVVSRLLVVASVVALFPVAMSSQNNPGSYRHAQDVEVVGALNDLIATSAEERELAELFDESGAPIQPGIPARRRTIFDFVAAPPPAPPGFVGPPIRPLENFICGGPGTRVLVGAIISRRTLLNTRGTLLLSAYRIRVDRWLVPATGRSHVVSGELGGRASVRGAMYETPVAFDLRLPEIDVPALFMLEPSGDIFQFGRPPALIDANFTLPGASGSASEILEQAAKAARGCPPK